MPQRADQSNGQAGQETQRPLSKRGEIGRGEEEREVRYRKFDLAGPDPGRPGGTSLSRRHRTRERSTLRSDLVLEARILFVYRPLRVGSAENGASFPYNLAMFMASIREVPAGPAAPGVVLAMALLQQGCSPSSDDQSPTTPAQAGSSVTTSNLAPAELDTMLLSEELIEGFRGQMGALAFAVRNLELPDKRTRRHFRPLDLQISDLATGINEPAPNPTLQSLGLVPQTWSIAEPTEATNASLQLWRPLFDQVDHFNWTKFKIKSGHFVEHASGEPNEFEALVAFSGLARLNSGEISWIRSRQTLRWRLIAGKDPKENENWRIVAWRSDSASRLNAPSPLFEDVLEDAIPNASQLETARVSIHERLVADRLLAKREGKAFTLPHRRFSDQAANRHPGLAIVDLDGDGFDDLYVVTRWGRNQLLHNRGDGTFEEKAAEYGLDIENFSSSALFADFDNDGDPDLFLGRTLERSAYYENQDGHFVDRSGELVDAPLPFFASSISATDFDGDGLLDIYVSTYSGTGMLPEHYGEYLSEADTAQVQRLSSAGNKAYLDQVGPPNVLLHNEGGGRFALVRDPGDLRSFRHTYQATWADFDGDGDPDVYLANDFAPDAVIRNNGEGRFVEMTGELGFRSFGLGMGASWGDYDRDGLQDVYVSNMYSTAGSRITNQLDFVDDRYREMAQGNYLYRNEGEQFRKVSGSTPPEFAVERTGWSWGSQFVDVDNDGFLDLGVLNGFYPAPREVAIAGDT